MLPTVNSLEVFAVGPSSVDTSLSSYSSHNDVSEDPRTVPFPSTCVAVPELPTGSTDNSASAIVDWQYIWAIADQSCLESRAISPVITTSGDPLLRGDKPAVVVKDHAAPPDDALLDFGHRIRSLWSVMNRKDGTSETIDTIRSDLHAISKQIETWMVSSVVSPESSQTHDIEKYMNMIQALEQENLDLSARTSSLERELQSAKAIGEAWKAEARNVQNMQEIAVVAFERCNSLETENLQLKQAVHAFAEGSTNSTVKELRQIISNLTREVAQYKKRETTLQAKETQMRAKENLSIIEDMRKQTEDLKRRRSQRTPLQVKN